LIKEAGIGWVRIHFPFPFEDKIGGKLTDGFLSRLQKAKRVKGLGFQLMGVTPLPGHKSYDPQSKQTVWRTLFPAWAGTIDSDSYYETYEKVGEELARQTRGIGDMWQISNEMDIPIFRSFAQTCLCRSAGIHGASIRGEICQLVGNCQPTATAISAQSNG
jgi:hypothetical protein